MFSNIGRIGKELDLKSVGDKQTSLVEFVMAFDFGFGESKRTEWLNMRAWGKTAEVICKYCAKGKQLFVIAEPQTSSWDGDSGNKRYKTSWVITRIKLIDRIDSIAANSKKKDESTGYSDLENDNDLPF